MILTRALPAALLLLATLPAQAAEWSVQNAKSHLGFSGTQTGVPFQGSFGKWTAAISFDPAHPETGHVTVVVDMASAQTGDTQRDTALPQPEWFDAQKFPQARFEATRFVAKGGNAYEAPGKLTIRDVSEDLVLPFTLTTTGDQAEARGHITLMRVGFGVGQGPWAAGDNVALEVGVDIDIVATKSGG